MLRKLIALAALSAAVVVAPATPVQADEGYSPKIPTETHITAKVKGPGKPVILHVRASANHPTPPEGDIRVTLSAASSTARGARAVAAAPLFTTTVHFVDEPVRIEGPALASGRYIATAEFTPDDADTFLPSDDLTGFRVGAGGETGGETEDNGGLPDTGGPNLLWLLLGTGLVAAGAGGVGYGRRRGAAAAA
ncbi:MAG TPA: hypothetical protein VNT31_04900 [Nocardioides sp.]|nr:hypothetical protein [Nocardioides sp.]